MNKLKALTWEYFFKQKLREVVLTIIIIMGIVVIPFLIGTLALYFLGEQIICKVLTSTETLICDTTFYGLWTFGFTSLVLITGITFLIKVWFKSNWKKAQEKAKRDVKK